jgi:DnaJ-class molecular chaperone
MRKAYTMAKNTVEPNRYKKCRVCDGKKGKWVTVVIEKKTKRVWEECSTCNGLGGIYIGNV